VYNRPHFPLDIDAEIFAAFKTRTNAGERAPDGTLTDAATGHSVRLSSLWRAPLVVEFGSFT